MGYRPKGVVVYLIRRKGVLFADDTFGCGIGSLVAFDACVRADFSECRELLVVVSGVDQVYYCVEEELVWGVVSFNWACEKSVNNL